MDSCQTQLCGLFTTAIQHAFPWYTGTTSVSRCKQSTNGDYQCNNAMAIFSSLKDRIKSQSSEQTSGTAMEDYRNPKMVAEAIVRHVPTTDSTIVGEVTTSGSGFINVRLNLKYMTERMRNWLQQDGVPPIQVQKQTVLVDFSSPNCSKDMHIGHLRSTIIGESIARFMEYVQHDVHRINHVGDWGTQFGMLIAYLRQEYPNYLSQPPSLEDLVQFYKQAKKLFDESEEFKRVSRDIVVALQRYDAEVIAAWQCFVLASRKANQKIYDRLDVTLEEQGESWYNSRIPGVVAELQKLNVVQVSEGAKIIWPFGEGGQNTRPPLMLVKSDGGYNYDTTDVTALHYRIFGLKCQRILYVVDKGQEVHFENLFKTAEICGWTKENGGVSVEHVKFGVVLGDDGKRMKTRAGKTVRLMDVLSDGVAGARQQLTERNQDFGEDELNQIAEVVGIGAVKYFDLNHLRTSDYKFDLAQMLSTKGNTAVYLLYQYARIRSIGRKTGLSMESTAAERLKMLEEHTQDGALAPSFESVEERALGIELLRFHDVCDEFNVELQPNKFTDYLYGVCELFSKFYDSQNILQSHEPLRSQRILLCESTCLVMKQALHLLGIKTVERM